MVNTQLKILRVFGPTGAEVSSVLRGIRDDGCPGLRLLERDGEFAICVQVSAPNRAMAEQYCDKWAARLRAKFGDDVFAEGETSLAQATLDALLEKLIAYTQSHGLQRLNGITMPNNRGMIGLARKLGFTVDIQLEDGIVSLSLPLNQG